MLCWWKRKKSGKLRVCIDFGNLNRATPKDEYPMPIANTLISNASENRIISFLDGNAGYNQICSMLPLTGARRRPHYRFCRPHAVSTMLKSAPCLLSTSAPLRFAVCRFLPSRHPLRCVDPTIGPPPRRLPRHHVFTVSAARRRSSSLHRRCTPSHHHSPIRMGDLPALRLKPFAELHPPLEIPWPRASSRFRLCHAYTEDLLCCCHVSIQAPRCRHNALCSAIGIRYKKDFS
jgi:hypothetical protein